MNTKMDRFIIICLISIFGLGCCKVKDEKLSMQRRSYTGNELQIDGYYYCYNAERIIVCVFYRNGVIRVCGSHESFQDFENKIDVYNTPTSKSYKEAWGVFMVEDSIIKYEKWYGARYLEPHQTYIYSGRVLNDTTFHITESYRPDGSEKNTLDFIYHFKQFYPKPDSTNNFIK